ncbi:MAG: methionyl-tRNA formyltransferase [Muribaculaceae bacterium]|nr:methionyl-tRNA formyltransferase [Muribaculaceae bacterium]
MEKKDLKIVFLGTPDFAVESLRRIADGGYNVVGVVTMPDKPAGRGKHLQQSAVKQFAVSRGLKVLQPVSLKDPDFVSELRSLGADLFVVIAFRMLPEVVWTMPRLGTFNLHASLLPRYRGAAPINRAVMNGDTETGVTTFFLKHEIDTGDIIAQERIAIGPDEDAGSVHDRLMELGARLTVDTIDHILAGDLKPVPQDSLLNGEEPTPAPKIFKETCRIDWTRSAQDIHNHVRGLAPYPAAWSCLYAAEGTLQGTLKVFATRILDEPSASAPGTLTVCGDRLIADTGTSRLELLSVQAPGKKRMPVADFLRGCRLSDMRLE